MSYSITVDRGSIGKVTSLLAIVELWELDDGDVEYLEIFDDGQISFIINMLADNCDHWAKESGVKLTSHALDRLKIAIGQQPDREDIK